MKRSILREYYYSLMDELTIHYSKIVYDKSLTEEERDKKEKEIMKTIQGKLKELHSYEEKETLFIDKPYAFVRNVKALMIIGLILITIPFSQADKTVVFADGTIYTPPAPPKFFFKTQPDTEESIKIEVEKSLKEMMRLSREYTRLRDQVGSLGEASLHYPEYMRVSAELTKARAKYYADLSKQEKFKKYQAVPFVPVIDAGSVVMQHDKDSQDEVMKGSTIYAKLRHYVQSVSTLDLKKLVSDHPDFLRSKVDPTVDYLTKRAFLRSSLGDKTVDTVHHPKLKKVLKDDKASYEDIIDAHHEVITDKAYSKAIQDYKDRGFSPESYCKVVDDFLATKDSAVKDKHKGLVASCAKYAEASKLGDETHAYKSYLDMMKEYALVIDPKQEHFTPEEMAQKSSKRLTESLDIIYGFQKSKKYECPAVIK